METITEFHGDMKLKIQTHGLETSRDYGSLHLFDICR